MSLKTAQMKMSSHYSLLQYSANNKTQVWTNIGSYLRISP